MKTTAQSIRSHIFGILSGPLLCFTLLLCPTHESLNEQGMKSLAAISWIIMWWMTEPFPLPFTALFGIVLYGLMGVLPLDKGLAFLSSPTCMLLLGSMLLLGAMKDSNVIERYTYKVVTSSWVAHSPTKLMILFGMATGILSAIMPNIPVAILFTSIAVALGKSMQAEPGHPLCQWRWCIGWRNGNTRRWRSQLACYRYHCFFFELRCAILGILRSRHGAVHSPTYCYDHSVLFLLPAQLFGTGGLLHTGCAS